MLFASCRWPLRLLLEQHVVVGVEQDAHRGAVAHVRVEADDGDVADDGRAHHAGDLRFADGDLLLEALAVVVVDALHDEHVAEVALPVAHEVAEPEVVREVAEAQVEALVRHVGGEGFDGSRAWRWRRGSASGARSARSPVAEATSPGEL